MLLTHRHTTRPPESPSQHHLPRPQHASQPHRPRLRDRRTGAPVLHAQGTWCITREKRGRCGGRDGRGGVSFFMSFSSHFPFWVGMFRLADGLGEDSD
jgi:hypothetical protein